MATPNTKNTTAQTAADVRTEVQKLSEQQTSEQPQGEQQPSDPGKVDYNAIAQDAYNEVRTSRVQVKKDDATRARVHAASVSPNLPCAGTSAEDRAKAALEFVAKVDEAFDQA